SHEDRAKLSSWPVVPLIRHREFSDSLCRRAKVHMQGQHHGACISAKSPGLYHLESLQAALNRSKVCNQTKAILSDNHLWHSSNTRMPADNMQFRQTNSFVPRSQSD